MTNRGNADLDATAGLIRRDTNLLLSARFFMSASQSLSSVALPLALIHAGFGPSGIGAVLATMILAGLFEMILVGGYADRGHLRVFLVSFPFTSVVCAIPFLTGADPIWLAVAAVVGGYGGGQGATSGGTGPYQPAEYAWVGRNYPNRDRNRIIGVFSAISVAGVVLGSIFAIEAGQLASLLGLGSGTGDQARAMMLVVAVLAVVPTAIGLIVKEPEHIAAPPSTGRSLRHQLDKWRELLIPTHSRKVLYRLSVVGGLNGLAVGCYGQFVTVWLILHFHASASTIGLLNLVMAAACVAVDLSCSRLARKLGLIQAVIVTRVVQSLLIIVISFSPNLLFAEVFLLIRMVAQRLNLPLRDSYSIARAAENEKARVSALTAISNQGGMAVSSEASGVMIARIGYAIPFCISAVLQLASALLFYAYFAREPPPEEEAATTQGASTPVSTEPVAAGAA